MKPLRARAALVATVAVSTVLGACASVMPPSLDHSYDATWPEEVNAAAPADGSIYHAGGDLPLFENAVARRVGDTVTINLVESTAAQKSSTTKTAKNTSIDLPGPKVFGKPVTLNGNPILSASVDNGTKFDGSGDSAQSNKLQGNVTVTVSKRLANGNLLVRGQKWIMINQGREFVRIQGIVRPVDISPSNTVPSYKVADASISYGSQGVIEAANSKSLLSRFFDSKWMPF
jgi:flagellar L-ring protein precursor FlgH